MKNILLNIKNSSLLKNVTDSAIWSSIGSFVLQSLSLLSLILIARFFNKSEYGELSILRSTILMITLFASLGFSITATKYISQYNAIDKIKTGKIIALLNILSISSAILFALLLLLLTPFIAYFFLDSPDLIFELRLGVLLLFFSTLNSIQNGILIGFESYRNIAIANIITALISFPIQLYLAYRLNVEGAIIGLGITYFILWLTNFFMVKKVLILNEIKLVYRDLKSESNILYSFSIPAFFSSLLVIPVLWYCNIMLVNSDNGFQELAVFDAANQWKTALLFIPNVLAQISLPLFSKHINDKSKFKEVLKINLIVTFVITFIIAFAVALFSKQIMNLYGSSYMDNYFLLIMLCVATLLISINGVIGQVLVGSGKMWIGLLFNFFWAILMLSSSWYFIWQGLGGISIAYALIFSYALLSVIQFLYVFKLMKN